MKEPRGALATRSGFYFLAFSSALGLGNLWRFPYIVGENGGGAFILLYVTLIFFLGAPLVIAELVVGKSAGRSLLASSIGFTNGLPIKTTRSGSWVGWLSFGMCLMVMSYYSIISGWSLYFFWKFILLNLRIEDVPYDVTKTKWLESNLQQIFWVGIHLLILGRIVVRGVSSSIERWINRLTPLLMILVLILMWNAVSLRTLEDVLRYVFYPDFTKLSWSSLTHAVGHVFFTLSIGLGVMVTYGSYINNEIQIPIVSIRIAVIDMILSFMSALLIVPLAMSASGIWVKDPVLIFEVLPRMFMQNAGGLLYGLLFFACISIAGINGMMGFYSTIVASLMDRLRISSRVKATWMGGLIILGLSVFPVVINNSLRGVALFNGMSFLELIDHLVVSFGIPIIVIIFIRYFQKAMPEPEKRARFYEHSNAVSISLYEGWMKIIKFIVVPTIVLGLLLSLLSLVN